MPRRCTVCLHPDRPAIDLMLVNHRPFRHISSRFSLSTRSLYRHHDDHLAETLAKAKAAEEQSRGDDLLEQLGAIRTKAISILVTAERTGDLKVALGAIREARGCIELLAELRQVLDRRPIVNVLMSPEWPMISAVVMEAVEGDPDRRLRVIERLRALEPRG